MPIPLPNQKYELRKRCHEIRSSLPADLRMEASQAICSLLKSWPLFQDAGTILTYMPIKSEVDLTLLLESYPQKRWVLPRILPGEEHRMLFHLYDPQRLVRHPFGMDEPAADLPTIAPLDSHGWRLGYGGGYFDRFLRDFPGISVGIVFQDLLVESVPHDRYDIPMHWLVTETGLFQCQPTKV